MQKEGVQRWLDAYVDAWKSYDPAQITSLFSADAEYRYSPFDEEPVVGAAAIATSWVEDGRQDTPDTYEAHYTPAALDGEIAVATGVSRYYTDVTRATLDREYHNAYLLRFAGAGKCVAFTE